MASSAQTETVRLLIEAKGAEGVQDLANRLDLTRGSIEALKDSFVRGDVSLENFRKSAASLSRQAQSLAADLKTAEAILDPLNTALAESDALLGKYASTATTATSAVKGLSDAAKEFKSLNDAVNVSLANSENELQALRSEDGNKINAALAESDAMLGKYAGSVTQAGTAVKGLSDDARQFKATNDALNVSLMNSENELHAIASADGNKINDALAESDAMLSKYASSATSAGTAVKGLGNAATQFAQQNAPVNAALAEGNKQLNALASAQNISRINGLNATIRNLGYGISDVFSNNGPLGQKVMGFANNVSGLLTGAFQAAGKTGPQFIAIAQAVEIATVGVGALLQAFRIKTVDDFFNVFRSGTEDAAKGIDGLKTRIKELTEQKHLIPIEVQELKAARAEVERIESALKAVENLQKQQAGTEDKSGKAVKEAFAEATDDTGQHIGAQAATGRIRATVVQDLTSQEQDRANREQAPLQARIKELQDKLDSQTDEDFDPEAVKEVSSLRRQLSAAKQKSTSNLSGITQGSTTNGVFTPAGADQALGSIVQGAQEGQGAQLAASQGQLAELARRSGLNTLSAKIKGANPAAQKTAADIKWATAAEKEVDAWSKTEDESVKREALEFQQFGVQVSALFREINTERTKAAEVKAKEIEDELRDFVAHVAELKRAGVATPGVDAKLADFGKRIEAARTVTPIAPTTEQRNKFADQQQQNKRKIELNRPVVAHESDVPEYEGEDFALDPALLRARQKAEIVGGAQSPKQTPAEKAVRAVGEARETVTKADDRKGRADAKKSDTESAKDYVNDFGEAYRATAANRLIENEASRLQGGPSVAPDDLAKSISAEIVAALKRHGASDLVAAGAAKQILDKVRDDTVPVLRSGDTPEQRFGNLQQRFGENQGVIQQVRQAGSTKNAKRQALTAKQQLAADKKAAAPKGTRKRKKPTEGFSSVGVSAPPDETPPQQPPQSPETGQSVALARNATTLNQAALGVSQGLSQAVQSLGSGQQQLFQEWARLSREVEQEQRSLLRRGGR